MQLLVGTSGFSYKQWLGYFYPEKLPPTAMLHYYAEHLPSVEINNTFYRMPDQAILERWFIEVPDRFSFTLKAPRLITHIKRLQNTEAELNDFLHRAERSS